MFLQSKEWEKILNLEGKKTERMILPNGEEIFFVYQKAGFSEYIFCPGGPKNLTEEDVRFLANFLMKRKAVFFRFEPNVKLETDKFKIQKTIDITPRATTILDLTKSKEGLLGAMHAKTRYNIRLAGKKNLRLAIGKDEQVFLALMRETAWRDKFSPHSEAHYKAILASPLSRQLTLFTSEGAPAATGVWVGYGKIFTYLFGASRYESRNLMAPYLIQWEAIKLGKELGYEEYDFFGITPQSAANPERHPYAGVTRFKVNFGGRITEKPGTLDLIISPLRYRIYEVLRFVRRLI